MTTFDASTFMLPPTDLPAAASRGASAAFLTLRGSLSRNDRLRLAAAGIESEDIAQQVTLLALSGEITTDAPTIAVTARNLARAAVKEALRTAAGGDAVDIAGSAADRADRTAPEDKDPDAQRSGVIGRGASVRALSRHDVMSVADWSRLAMRPADALSDITHRRAALALALDSPAALDSLTLAEREALAATLAAAPDAVHAATVPVGPVPADAATGSRSPDPRPIVAPVDREPRPERLARLAAERSARLAATCAALVASNARESADRSGSESDRERAATLAAEASDARTGATALRRERERACLSRSERVAIDSRPVVGPVVIDNAGPVALFLSAADGPGFRPTESVRERRRVIGSRSRRLARYDRSGVFAGYVIDDRSQSADRLPFPLRPDGTADAVAPFGPADVYGVRGDWLPGKSPRLRLRSLLGADAPDSLRRSLRRASLSFAASARSLSGAAVRSAPVQVPARPLAPITREDSRPLSLATGSLAAVVGPVPVPVPYLPASGRRAAIGALTPNGTARGFRWLPVDPRPLYGPADSGVCESSARLASRLAAIGALWSDAAEPGPLYDRRA